MLSIIVTPVRSHAEDADSKETSAPVAVIGHVFENRRHPLFRSESWEFRGGGSSIAPSTGDFNGDARDDLILQVSGTDVLLALATAESSFLPERWEIRGLGAIPNGLTVLAAGDIDGDGRSDLILRDPKTAQSFVGFAQDEEGFAVQGLRQLTADRHFTLADISCDGRKDVVFPILGSEMSWLEYSRAGAGTGPGELVERSLDVRTVHSGPSPGNYTGSAIKHRRGCERLLIRTRSPTRWETLAMGEMIPWGTALKEVTWGNELVGDFNGDGFSDILVEEASAPFRWSAIFGGGRAGIERSATAPCGIRLGDAKLPVGDFDGDGLSDIVTGNADGKLRICTAVPGDVIRESVLIASTGAQISADRTGAFRLEASAGSRLDIKVAEPGYIEPIHSIRIPVHARRVVMNFVKDDPPRRGQSIGLAEMYPGPYACIGFTPEREEPWNAQSACPKNYAPLSLGQAMRRVRTPDALAIASNCCPLPSNDILTSEHVGSAGACPDGQIIIGFLGPPQEYCINCRREILCAQINTARYQLGPSSPGYYWGLGSHSIGENLRVYRESAPAAIAEAIGRGGYYDGDTSGCIGSPWGSLPVSVAPGACSAYRFRQLQYSGAPGDPPRGTPVPMFPECRSIENRFDPTSGCSDQRR